jgi:DNA-directed RNA polymerase specialized sigma24 family protein
MVGSVQPLGRLRGPKTMTKVERPVDYNEAVNDFLKLHQQELELQALKLSRLYRIDLHELLSRTTETVWKKWSDVLCTLPQDNSYKYVLRIMSNHARNLSRNARRDESKCESLPGEELESLTYATITWRDPVAVEAIFEDERFAIYKAISLLDGRCRDVMALIALGLENSEIRQELGLTETNLTSILWRARKSLREILALGDNCEGGEPR